MWPLLWLFVLARAEAELPPCESQVIFLNESWSSWYLLPPGNFSLNSTCSYTLVYPNDTALCGLFVSSEQWERDFIETIGGVDAFGSTVNLKLFRSLTCLPPSWYSIFLPPSRYGLALLSIDDFCQNNACTKFHLRKIDAFKRNETVPVTPGMEPFVIRANGPNSGKITYKIDGYPELTAAYVKSIDYYYSYNRTPLDAESFFIYNDLGQMIGTPAMWHGVVQHFSQLIVHSMGPGSQNQPADHPGLLAIMARADLEDLVNPTFIQPYYGLVSADASHGQTSVTIVDADSYSNQCIQYNMAYFTFSEDVDILVHDGFPKQNFTEDMAIMRLNATTLTPDFMMILGCTKTLRILQGSLNFFISPMDVGIANFLIRKKTVKGFIKIEKKALKRLRRKKINVNFLCNKRPCNFTVGMTWRKDSPTVARLGLERFGPTGSRIDSYSPPETIDWEATDQYMLTMSMSGGAIEFEINESDPE